MIRIGLVGYGRMGRQIEAVMKGKELDVATIIDPFAPDAMFKEINEESTKDVDVIIDFSSPEVAFSNIQKYVALGVNAVIGTTGWNERLEEVKTLVGDKIGLVWSGNFSLGVNLYFKMVDYASKLVGAVARDSYDPMIHEYHHNQKKDSPSGTALMIADIVKAGFDNKSDIFTQRLDRKIEPKEIHLSSTRGGFIPGTHTVLFDSLVDTIELTHTARTREGFAAGSVTAALWIADKKGVKNFSELFDEINV